MDENEEEKGGSMMEIVNAEYREIENLDEKSTEELTAKTNTLYQQMQMIGAMGIQDGGRSQTSHAGNDNGGGKCRKLKPARSAAGSLSQTETRPSTAAKSATVQTAAGKR